jgi:hypothetical protein
MKRRRKKKPRFFLHDQKQNERKKKGNCRGVDIIAVTFSLIDMISIFTFEKQQKLIRWSV